MPRTRQVDRYVDTRSPFLHHADTISQEHRLLYIVHDQHGCEAAASPQSPCEDVRADTRHCVERSHRPIEKRDLERLDARSSPHRKTSSSDNNYPQESPNGDRRAPKPPLPKTTLQRLERARATSPRVFPRTNSHAQITSSCWRLLRHSGTLSVAPLLADVRCRTLPVRVGRRSRRGSTPLRLLGSWANRRLRICSGLPTVLIATVLRKYERNEKSLDCLVTTPSLGDGR